MPLNHCNNHRFSMSKITGFRRPRQTSQHQQQPPPPEYDYAEPDQSLNRPLHYHSYNRAHPPHQHQHSPSSSTSSRHPQRVRFADDLTTNTHPQPAQYHPRSRRSSHSSSAHTSSAPVSTSSSRCSSFELEPSGPIAEWCHQMHLLQKRQYDWCQGCFPRPVMMYSGAVECEEAGEGRHVDAHQQQILALEQELQHLRVRERERERTDTMVRRVRQEREASHAYE